MDFELYMAALKAKPNPTMFKPNPAQTQRKAQNIGQFKSRSHSPIAPRTPQANKTNRKDISMKGHISMKGDI